MRIPTLLVVLGALAGSASAKTTYHRTAIVPAEDNQAFGFGHADKLTVERADLSLTTDGGALRGTLQIVLSTWDDKNEDRSILIAIPDGTEVSTLAVSIGSERFEGHIGHAGRARHEYEETVRQLKDPALLEWVSSSPTQTWLRLRVFPVTPKTPATIEIGISLRHTASIAIDPGVYRFGHASIDVDGALEATSKLDTRLEVDVPETTEVFVPAARETIVQRRYSLFAGPAVDDLAFDGRPVVNPRTMWTRVPEL